MMVIALLFCSPAVQEGNNIPTDTLFPSPKITFGHWTEYWSLYKYAEEYVVRWCFHTSLTLLEGCLLKIIASRLFGQGKTSVVIVTLFTYKVFDRYTHYSHYIHPDDLVQK